MDCEPIHIELKKGAKPSAQWYYNIPKAYEGVIKCEVKRMCDIGVLEKLDHWTNSPWAAPTFVQAKKTGDVRVLTDLWEVNKNIKRKPFLLPQINNLIQKMQRFKAATALDLSQGYYSVPIDKESSQICTTILPWGNYSFKRLPMGLCSAPDIF